MGVPEGRFGPPGFAAQGPTREIGVAVDPSAAGDIELRAGQITELKIEY